jgi:hypothetical protein
MIAALALGGCASTSAKPAAETWVGGDATHLSADKAECRKEAAELDVNEPANYSDPRYGVTSAMAAAIAEDNPLVNTRPQIKAAAFTTCMNDKGWRQP